MKNKNLFPRKEVPVIGKFNEKTRTVKYTSKDRTAIERAEVDADVEFAQWFSDEAMKAWFRNMMVEIQGRKLSDAFDDDPATASRIESYERSATVAPLILKASPSELRTLRLVFEAGASWVEGRAYRHALETSGGRPPEPWHAELGKIVNEFPNLSARETYARLRKIPGLVRTEIVTPERPGKQPGITMAAVTKNVPSFETVRNRMGELKKNSRKPFL